LEANCKAYVHPTTGAVTNKPVGLLQQYGDVDAARPVRFGLMTGSYAANKSGGVLRKNIGLITNNLKRDIKSNSVCSNNDPNDEIDVCTGQFINQADNQAGIINTLNRLHIAGFKYTNTGTNGSYQYSCNTPGKLTFDNGQCVDWGNPLTETYLESLRYFANAGATLTFDVSDANILSSIPQVSWTDPLPSNHWCALSNIIVLSTGLNSFDTDELASFTPSGGSPINANTLTQTLGDSSHENINGNNYLIGNNTITTSTVAASNQCTAKTISNLANANGICPEVPSTLGGYGIAGLAYAPKTIDIRPNYATLRNKRWGDDPSTVANDPINADWALRQPLNTYTVQLGETLPSFNPISGVTMVPACQAKAGSDPWRSCSMTNLVVNENVGQTDVGTDTSAKTKTCSGNGNTSRCFTVAWEDSTWGNDYDMDGIQRLGYCVGSACSSFKMLCPSTSSAHATIGPWSVGANDIVIATCAVQAQAGHSLRFGYTIAGTTNDGASFPIDRPGGNNFNVGSPRPSGVTAPSNVTFIKGSSTAQLLKNPLWYTAKYGGFTESTPISGTPNPNQISEWDQVNNITNAAGSDGEPDNYFNVRNPANLFAALSRVFDRASTPDASAASVATNSTNLQINSRIFQAKFSSADWSGQLLSYIINTSGVLTTTAEWDAGVIINTQNPITERTIITKGATDGVAFSYANLTGPTTTANTQMSLLDKNALGVTDNCGSERVAYLRGDPTHESANGTFTCASGTTISNFRPRNTSKLGDIVNSSPVYVSTPSAGYSDATNPGYSAFQSAKQNRKPMLYVGGNDGILHGFDASLDFSSNPVGVPIANVSGKELLAYIPSAVYPNLSRLNEQNYHKNHRYFVDGSPMVGDADLDSTTNNVWRTLLVGSMGAGGKGYFALDVTDPASFSEATTPTDVPANILLWEFDETDMGYVFNLPPVNSRTKQAKQIVKMANGKWAAILSNGYNSISGKAVLYVVYIEDGVDGTWSSTDYEKIVADAPTGMDNGLSTPVPFDTNNDGYADTVYAGDIKGHMWKFLIGPNTSDTSITSSSSTWKVAFSTNNCATTSPSTCIPLFTATDNAGSPQPILGPPEITLHPNNGQLVLFGTGKYIEPSDNTDNSVQSFYGIWDKHNNAATTLNNRDEELLQQTLSNTACSSPPTANIACTLTTVSGSFRIPSTNPINWRVSTGDDANCLGTCTPTHMGWFIDLPSLGERATGIPQLINKVIFFNTLIPSTAPCDAGGTGWLLSLDYLSGGLVIRPIFDTDGSGTFTSADVNVGGFQVGAALGGTTLIQNVSSSNTSNIGVGVSSLTSGKLGTALIDFGSGVLGHRQSWRELYP
jgi:type IV pilus assembly protein PilY1